MEEKYMKLAIEEAKEGIMNDHGGPFGTVIVKDGEIVATGHNRVLLNNDPTAHGEIEAIRAAGRRLGTFDLSGCTLYTTGEPCHMCLCACMWANIDKICGGRDKLEGFMSELDRQSCLELFNLYRSLKRKIY